jgi:hypothetical protein
MPRVLVFDVNGALLDLRVLEPHFRRVFGDQNAARWFSHWSICRAVTLADSTGTSAKSRAQRK